MNAWKVLRTLSLVGLATLTASAGVAQAQATKAPATRPQEKAKGQEKGRATAPAAGPIDVNSATTAELMEVPGIGEAYARKIVEGRPYKSVDDVTKAGVPAATVAKAKDRLVARPLPTAVDVNRDSAERLATLPGIGPATAKAIVENRPYTDYADLAKVRGLGPAKIDELRGRVTFGDPKTTTGKLKAAAEATGGAIKANLGEAKREMKSRAGQAKDELGDAAGKAKAKLGDAADTAKSKLGDAAKTAKSKVGEAADTVRKKAEASKDRAEEAKPKLAPGQKVNINTATKDDLDKLFGIGPVRAQAIIDARPFSKPEDIMKVKGIKEVEYKKIKDHIVVK